jgi:hypothetical protein
MDRSHKEKTHACHEYHDDPKACVEDHCCNWFVYYMRVGLYISSLLQLVGVLYESCCNWFAYYMRVGLYISSLLQLVCVLYESWFVYIIIAATGLCII